MADEDEVEHLFEGLIDVVPELPLTQESLQIFITTLRSIIPNLEIKENIEISQPVKTDIVEKFSDFMEDLSEKVLPVVNKIALDFSSAIILTKRPTITAGVLHELTQLSEKPQGEFRETALNIIQEEFVNSEKGKHQKIEDTKKLNKEKIFAPIAPLELSDSQADVINLIKKNNFVAVYGPPGTGKSQTIVNIASDLIANGKTVLVVSRMDKAVDVVAERLNALGAPFLSLRAGRPNYQKQLNSQLQDLLANKVDLDTGYESAVLVSLEDMNNLVKTREDLESKCQKIIELEAYWKEVLCEFNKQNEFLGNNKVINKVLELDEIEKARNILVRIENILNKTDFFSSLVKRFLFSNLKKILEIETLELEFKNIDILRQNLILKILENQLKEIEISITKIGNLHQLLENIKELRLKQKDLSIEILRKQRRDALKALTRDQLKRQRLIVHSKALIERKKNLELFC